MKQLRGKQTGSFWYQNKLYNYIWLKEEDIVEIHRHAETIAKFKCEDRDQLLPLMEQELKQLDLQKQRDVYIEPEEDFNQDK
jgi:hypothetical protein